MAYGRIYTSDFKDANGNTFTVDILEKDVVEALTLGADDFNYRLELNIQASKIPADISNFTGYIDLSIITSDTFWNNVTDSNGGDIRMAKSDQSQMPAFVARFDSSTKVGSLWYRFSGTLSSSTNTLIYIYFGSSGLTAPANGATYGRDNTFQDYGGAFGMDAAPNLGTTADWTGNSNTLTNVNMEAGDQGNHANGMWNYTYDGVDEYSTTDTPSFEGDTTGALSAWVKIGSIFGADGTTAIAAYGGGAAAHANPGVTYLNKRRRDPVDTDTHFDITSRTENTTNVTGYIGDTALAAGTTYHVVFVDEGAGQQIYVNGVAETLTKWLGSATGVKWFGQTNALPTTKFQIANNYTDGVQGSNWSDDTIGPVLVKSAPPTADYITTEYNNQSDSSTFYSIGSFEEPGASIETLKLANPPVILEWGSSTEDKFNPIIGSTCTVNVMVETNFDYREFIDGDEEKYIIRITYSENTYWVGPMMQENFIEMYHGVPYVLKLKATDGLGRLKNIEGPNSFASTLQTIGATVAGAIGELNHNTEMDGILEAVNVYENSHNSTTSDSPFLQTQVDTNHYTAIKQGTQEHLSYWDILQNILIAFGARMYFSYEDSLTGWYLVVERIGEKQSADPTVRRYNTSYTYVDNPSITWLRTFTDSASAADEYNAIIPIMKDQVLEIMRGAPLVRLTFKTGKPKGDLDNALPDGYFEHKLVGSAWASATSLNNWTGGGTPTLARVNFPFPPFGEDNDQWGVQHATQGITRYIENDLPAVYFEGPGADNQVAFRFRMSYQATLTSPASITTGYYINTYPQFGVEIRITDSVNTYYLEKDSSNGWQWVDPLATPITFKFNRCASRQEGEKFAGVLPSSNNVDPIGVPTYGWDRFQEFSIPATTPPIEGDIYIRLKAFDTSGASPSNDQREIIDFGVTSHYENCAPIYREAVVKILSATGFPEDKEVTFELTNANNVTGPKYEKTTIHGDAKDGAGLNTGTLYDQNGVATTTWTRKGETDNVSLLKITVNDYLANYKTPSFKLTGSYRYGDPDKMLFLGRFKLSEGLTDRYLLPASWRQNLQDCQVNGEWLQNLGSFTAYTAPDEQGDTPTPDYPAE